VAGISVGPYRVLEKLGAGGMGEVYLAHDPRLQRNVALKSVTGDWVRDSDAHHRLVREARAAGALNHPAIAAIYDIIEIDGRTYIVMEYVQGETLAALLRRGRLPLERVVEIGIQLADGLVAAHAAGIVHRDLKPGNVCVMPDGRVKILDFGLARTGSQPINRTADGRLQLEAITEPDRLIGSPGYMAPEQILGKPIDQRSDVFSLGVILFELSTGRLPFGGRGVFEMAMATLTERIPAASELDPGIPRTFSTVVATAMAREPSSRHQSAQELGADLRRVAKSLSGDKTRPAALLDDVVARMRRLRRQARLRRVAVIAAIVLIAAIVWLSFSRSRSGAGPSPPADRQHTTIAVLPFQYEGETRAYEYLGALVPEALIAGLQPLQNLSTAPYRTIRALPNGTGVVDAARILGVQWVVHGSVAARGSDLVVRASLTSAQGDAVWSETLVGPLLQPLATLETVKARMIQRLDVREDGVRDISQVRTPSLQAYEKYLAASSSHRGWDIEGNLDEAVSLYREALRLDPDFAAAHAGLALALLSRFGRTEDPGIKAAAADAAGRALALDPDLPEASLAHGMVAALSGDTVEARAAFDRTVRLAPGNDDACANIAQLYAKLGRYADAQTMYERASALRPAYWRHHYDLGVFLWRLKGDLTAAQSRLEQAAALHPDGPAPFVGLAYVHLTRGRLDDAEACFRKAQDRSPHPSTQYGLGLVHYYRGQYELALRNWRAVLAAAPDRPLYRAAVADALRQLGQRDEARRQYTQASTGFRAQLADNPQDDVTRGGLAMTLAGLGECRMAGEEARSALERHPKSPELAYYAAVTAIRCGDESTALRVVLDAVGGSDPSGMMAIRFDPELASVRRVPGVREALSRAGLPIP
jgi:tetratricopeptide (TPR) repeat protein/TolB-like protein/predicted Ser/Thr protein kinase